MTVIVRILQYRVYLSNKAGKIMKKINVLSILLLAGMGFSYSSIGADLDQNCGRLKTGDDFNRLNEILDCIESKINVRSSMKLEHEQNLSPFPPTDPRQVPTKYPGVMARITLETIGEFTTLGITVTNTNTDKKEILVHSLLQKDEQQLSDQHTGDSWEPVNIGGTLSSRNALLRASGESGVWMQFKIPNPEQRVFLLKCDLFDIPVGNLVVGQPR